MIDKIENGTCSLKELSIIYLVSATAVAIVFALVECRNIIESFWWTFVTGLTIGYGDIYPHTIIGQAIAVIWAHFMVLLFIPLAVGRVVVTMIHNKNEFTDTEQKEMLRILRKIDKK